MSEAVLIEAPQPDSSELDELAEAAYQLVASEGVTPTEAAERVVVLGRLSEASLLFAVQRYVGQRAGAFKSSHIRESRQGKKSDRSLRIERAVKTMEITVAGALEVLLLQKQGADGVERALRDFTTEDHQYRIDIESRIASGAWERRTWHEAALALLEQQGVKTVGELSLPDQYTLARLFQGDA